MTDEPAGRPGPEGLHGPAVAVPDPGAPDTPTGPDGPDGDGEGRGDGDGGATPLHQVSRFGDPGTPFARSHPLYFGFFAAIGALIAYYLLQVFGQLSYVLTLIGIAIFLAMGLDPLVRSLQRRGLGRGSAVFVVFLILLAAVGGFMAAVLPAVITQVGEFSQRAPDYVDNLLSSRFFRELDEEYGIVRNLSEQLRERVTSGETITTLFGGIVGAGRAVLGGVASTFTVLVLTLYFLASLRNMAETCYRLVPRSRRPRVRLLGDEIIRRIGGYVAGQTAVATINAVLTYIVVTVLDLPYAALLAIAVGLFGLIPLVGATIGAVIVVLVGLSVSWQVSVGLAVYYLVYQQIENYLIAPRIMSRTVAVPGSVALIAALAGGSLLGVLGALVAIPIAAAIMLIVQEVVIPRQEQV